MSKKHTPHHPEPANRPVFLGILILAAGAYSTWYWYKPLPALDDRISASPWEQDRSAEWNWTDAAVLRPTMEDLQSSPHSVELASDVATPNSALVAAPPPDFPRTGSGLIAAPNIKWQLNSAADFEPPPKSPDIHLPEGAIVGTVKPWVDYDTLSEASLTDVKYDWPTQHPTQTASTEGAERNEPGTRAILSSGTLDQPVGPLGENAGSVLNNPLHRPTQPLASPLPASSEGFDPPKLLDTKAKRIRVDEEEGKPPLPPLHSATEFTATPPRTPLYIRQPKGN